MPKFVTKLVNDEPAVILLGENTPLRQKLAFTLKHKNVNVSLVEPTNLGARFSELNQAYKVIWLADKNNNYLSFLQQLAKLQTPLVVVLPVFTGINFCESDLLKFWLNETQTQLQFIVDCNYYLSTASFIFGQNVVGNDQDNSIFKYLLSSIKNKVLVDPVLAFDFLSIDDFVNQVVELVFIPKRQLSFLIKGKLVNSTGFIALIKKLYDAYHNTDLEILQDKLSFSPAVPFSVLERVVNSDQRAVATYLVKKLPAPTKETKTVEPVIPSPKKIVPAPVKKPLVQDYKQKVTPQVSSPVTPKPKTTSVSPRVAKKEPEDSSLNQEIQRIFKDTRVNEKVERVKKIAKSTKKIAKKSKRRTKLFYGGLLSIGMAVGIILLTVVYVISSNLLQSQVVKYLNRTAETKDLTTQVDAAILKNKAFVESQTNLYGQVLELNLVAKNDVLVGLVAQFETLPKVLLEADQASKNLVLNIINSSIGETSELTKNLTQKVSEAYEKLSLIQATLEQVDLGNFSEKQQTVIDQIGEKIKELRSGLEVHQQLQQILPDMVGVSNKRTYALLLQNNQELRPTGGFIQAVALVNFDKGSLVSYKVYSVYQLDKRLPGEVVPPEDITTFLGEENWYLRDSNWNPDFPKSSKQIEWFIEKSLGVNVDGVISMNIFSLEEIIKAVGPIELPEYNEVLTSKNIEERMEFHSEVVLVDSPESIDYSVKVLDSVLKALTLLEEKNVPTLLSGLRHSLDTKQTQIYSNVESEESILKTLGWTGDMVPPNCPSRLSVVDCVVDNLVQVETNIGVNKANYYLDRTIDHSILVSKSVAKHKRKVTFKNRAQSNAWPKGTYRSYIRFYINPNSVVDKVMINGSELLEKQIFQKEENGYKVVAVRVDVPIQKQLSLEFDYSTPLTTEGSFSYVFYNSKQSGLDSDPFRVKINYSPDLKPVLVAPSATISGREIVFSAKTLDDASLFGVQFE